MLDCSDFFLEDFEGGFVVGFVGDFADEVAEDDAAVLVHDDDGACQESGEGAVDQKEAVLLSEEGRAEGRAEEHVLDAFDRAEAAHREGEVHGDADHCHVVKFGGLLVEPAHRAGAYLGVEAGEDVEHDAFAGEVRADELRQVGASRGGSRVRSRPRRGVCRRCGRVCL